MFYNASAKAAHLVVYTPCRQFQKKGGCEKIKFKTSFFAAPQSFAIFQSTPSSRKVTSSVQHLFRIRAISIHTFLKEGDIKSGSRHFDYFLFQSTPSLRKVTVYDTDKGLWHKISIHTFLAEGDYGNSVLVQYRYQFQSTPFSRKVTFQDNARFRWVSFYFNPHLPRGRWQFKNKFYRCLHRYFNPHLPRGRWLQTALPSKSTAKIFQSTPSSRKVTFGSIFHFSYSFHFNPHLPRGRWLRAYSCSHRSEYISIHTFLAEGDVVFWFCPLPHLYFNPHLPRGRWHLK